jgi:hypothetical protein
MTNEEKTSLKAACLQAATTLIAARDSINLDPAVGGCAEWPDLRIGPLWEQI